MKHLLLRCILLRQGSLASLSKMTQTPESKSKAPSPTAEPNKHWGQAISATQRQALQYQSQTPLSHCTPRAWQVFSWPAATGIWKVNNLYVTWLDWSFRHPQACYDLRTPTSATRLVKISGTSHILGMEMRENGNIYLGVLSKPSVIKERRPKGLGWEWKWWRLLEVPAGGKFPATGFGFEWVQESLIWVSQLGDSRRKLRPPPCVLESPVS